MSLNNTLDKLSSICLFDSLVIVFQHKNIKINQLDYKRSCFHTVFTYIETSRAVVLPHIRSLESR